MKVMNLECGLSSVGLSLDDEQELTICRINFLNNARLNVCIQTYGAGGTNTNRPESKKCTNYD